MYSMIKRIFLTIIFLLFSATYLFAGTAYYVDLNNSGSSNAGTIANPYNTSATVYGLDLNTGDDLYFKGTGTHNMSHKIRIRWNGTSGDRVEVGCYNSVANDCGAGNYATINSSAIGTYPDYINAVEVARDPKEEVFVTIQNLRVEYPPDTGITVSRVKEFLIDDCYVYRSKRSAIQVFRSDTGSVTNCVVEGSTWERSGTPSGSIIAVANSTVVGQRTFDVTFSHNRVFDGEGEGIGVYKKCMGVTIEYNEVYDQNSYNIYVDASSNTIIRYNLVYNSGTRPPDGDLSSLIHMDNEAERDYCYYDDNEIYGNIIAGGKNGITIQNTEPGCASSGHRVYNNTIVDCATNIKMDSTGTGATHSDVIIENNISWTISEDSNHVEGCSESGVTWNNNLWDNDPGTGYCDDAEDPANASPELSKASGWRSLIAGGVTGSEFELTSNSPAITGGTDLGTSLEYVLIPGTGNMSEDPIDPFTPANADDYGGWPYGAFLGGLTISAGFPTSLLECGTTQTFGVTSSANATCRFSVKGADTCATAYADLDEAFETTGATTTHTDTDETFACDNTDTLVVICNDDSTSQDSNCLEITVDVAAASGNPQPPPIGFGAGGNVSSGAGGNVTVGTQ